MTLEEAQKLEKEVGLEDETEKIIHGEPKEPTPQPSEEEEPEETLEQGEEEEVEPNRPVRGIPTREFNQVRKEKAELLQQLKEREARIAELERASQKPPVSDDEIAAAAKELAPQNATPEQVEATKFQLKKILDLASKGTRMSDSDKQEYLELKDAIADFKDEKTFRDEWETFSDEITKSYSQATPKQWREAEKAMDELAHAPQFADKEFDYVYFRNKDIFDEILGAPRKKSLETKEMYVPPEEETGEEEDLNKVDVRKLSKTSPEKLIKLHEKLKQQADNEDDYNILYQGRKLG